MTEQATQWSDGAAFITDKVASRAHDAIDVAATRLCGAEERARDAAATALARLGAARVRSGALAVVGCAVTAGIVAAALLRRR